MDSNDLKKLNGERVALIAQAQDLLKKGTLSADDDTKFNAMMKEADEKKATIDKFHAINNLQKDVDLVQARIHTYDVSSSSAKLKTDFRASDEYKNTFWDVLKSNPEQLSQISYRNVLQTDTGGAGGFLVPIEMHNMILKSVAQANFMRQIATTITTANDRDIPIETTLGPATWLAQSGPYVESDSVFSQKILKAYKLTKLTKVSEELMQDSAFDMAAYLAEAAGRSFGIAENAAMMVGNGTTQPRGITLDGTAFPLGGVAVTAPLLIDIYHTLDQAYRSNASWIMHPTTLAAMRKLADTAGAFYFLPSMTVGAPDTILGRPVYTSYSMPTIAAGAKSIVFGDISYYYIGQRSGYSFQRLMELYAGNGQIGFMAKERVDGLLTLNAAVVVAASP